MSFNSFINKIEMMSQDQLMNEIQSLHKKLGRMNPHSGMVQQVQDMIQMANTEYNERIIIERAAEKDDDGIINIGEIEEVVYTPDYTDTDLFVEVVKHYSGDRISKRKQDRIEKDQRIQQQLTDANKFKPKPITSDTQAIMDDIPVFGKMSNKTK
tara:strand:- start:368 stop:832 length:465 start_codon:yes stop_codon:yes gene_type:complete